jgi:hypothetical protein
VARAAIEGTQLPRDLVRANATEHPPTIVFDKERSQSPLVRRRRVTYFGFELEREDDPIRDWRGAVGAEARRVLAEALARGEALHPAVRRNQPQIDEVREVWRRSGGVTPKLGLSELTSLYERTLAGVEDVHQWRAARLQLDLESVVPREQRVQWLRLPRAVEIQGRAVPLEYDVEQDGNGALVGVVRLRLQEKLARFLSDEDVPELDRPVRFVVYRGAQGTVRAASIAELRELLKTGRREDGERQRQKTRRREDGKTRRHGKKPPWPGKRGRRR